MSKAAAPDERYGWYALGVLFVAYVLAFVDRQVLNLLSEPIKRDLQLSDVQLGLLQGLAFALLLAVCAFPMGRLIDRGPRTRLLAGAVTGWSLATMACGFAGNFMQLLGARMAVGAGEAAVTPSAYSLIGDYVPARRWGLAVGIFSMGSYLGSGLALIFGAGLASMMREGTSTLPVVGTLHSWQMVFLAVGAPGFLVALWVASLREPRRGRAETQPPPSAAAALAYLHENRSALGFTNMAVAFGAMAIYALNAWLPSLMARRFGVAAHEIGGALGLEVLAFGCAGTFAAGWVGDLRRRKEGDGRLQVMLAAGVVALPLAAATALASSVELVLVLLAPLLFALAALLGSGPATLQEITPNRLRGLQHALAVFTANLIGLGLGPLVVAFTTDHLLKDEARLGESMALCLPLMILASVCCAALARGPYRQSLRRHGTEATGRS